MKCFFASLREKTVAWRWPWPRGRRVPGSEPDSAEEPPCKRIWGTPSPSELVWCGNLKRGCQLSCGPRHLRAVQNPSPKIALVLLQNGALIKLN
ncbi:hypothetical protein AVEN_1304-1 [Araneus ventricosus]|uniref:Uncharacterized protein n=1 Tax=Araneus ventricosus TaxID=182803 RepID=A0A4Y2PTM1_ARAVE|nr:hypothetical protein AVEN_1304-1 [Araneus ventricosus]